MRKIFWFVLTCIVVAAIATWFFNADHVVHSKRHKIHSDDDSSFVADAQVDSVEVIGILPPVNDTLTDLGRFIAGVPPEKIKMWKEWSKDSAWMDYRKEIDRSWQRFVKARLQHMDTFYREELKAKLPVNYNVFYPFSGPDLLHAVTFFPDADTMLMIALEPPGELDHLYDKSFEDSMEVYFGGVRQSLHAILNWSFFITKKMFKDLRKEELNGAVHLLNWFAIRRGYALTQVRPVVLDKEGNVHVRQGKRDTLYAHHKTKGMEVSIRKGDHAMTIYYFSADLSDYGIRKNNELNKMLNGFDYDVSMVKSASYLLHSTNFSTVRKMILTRSKVHLQDDSGIPYRYFSNRKDVNVRLYGAFDGPIGVFKQYPQEDLQRAYDSLEVTPITFGIGYKHRKDESNWMVVKREVNYFSVVTGRLSLGSSI